MKNLYLYALIAIVVIYMLTSKESFSQRYMYMYNPTTRNQSYDIRGDQYAISRKNHGIFKNSSIEKNHGDSFLTQI